MRRLVGLCITLMVLSMSIGIPPVAHSAGQTPPPQVIEGLLHQGHKMMLAGTSKSNKTWCLIDLALSVASGQPWWGRPCRQSPTVYINFELPPWAMQNRLSAVCQARPECGSAQDTLAVWNLRGHSADLGALRPRLEDELRGAPRPDTLRHLADDIESDVVDALIDAVSRRFDIPSRYYELKAALLRVKRLQYHERNVEYGVVARRYPYPQAINLVWRVMNKLDGRFGDILAGFVKNDQIDAYPRKGKDSGAFCMHHLLVQPTYILLNHAGKLHDVLTIAHEVGHGINNELIREKQHALDFGTPTSTAEVASTFMEDFVLDDILQTADDELRLAIMMQKLNDDVSSIFRQAACYRFEQELHGEFRKRGYLSKEEIGKLFQKHMAAYMGKAVEQSAGSENWWVYWSHIRYFFYVYSYASGLLISKSLQSSVKKDPAFIGKVKEFLSAGLSDSPKNIFSKLGIDIADKQFWNKGLDEIEKLLNETEALAKKWGR